MNKVRQFRLVSTLIAVVLLLSIAVGGVIALHAKGALATSSVQHYEYFVPDGSLYVYDIDNSFSLVKHVTLPTSNVRGVSANVKTGMLYVSYGGDGGGHGTGSMLEYNLLTDTIVWNRNYTFGIDSMDITPDGKTIYMPDGEASYDGLWHIIDATTGNVLSSINIGAGYAAHNTLLNSSGTHVYMGALNYNYLVEADTATNQIIKRIGPLYAGVRPFTINREETLAFTTATGFVGFEVSDINTGKKLYTVPIPGFPSPAGANAPSHGITLSPDEKTLYVVDGAYSYAHVYDVSGLPAQAPVHLADIKLTQGFTGNEVPCGYDCTHEGWILYTADGRYVLVGDSGDIIDTATRKTVMDLTTLNNTRKFLEVDWSNGVPSYATSRMSVNLGTPLTTTGTPTSTTTTTATPSTTVTPGTVLAQDTFQRANQSLWGTASDGLQWTGDANTNTNFSIKGNAGALTGNANPYNALLGASTNDAEVLFSGSLGNFSNGNLGAVLRWTDTNNWYKAYINGTQLIIQARVNGTSTTLASVNFAATADTSYTIRFRAVGTNLYANAWPGSGTEPTGWLATATSSALTTGYPGLRIQAPGGATALVTSYLATTPGSSVTPTPTPVVPSPTATTTPVTTPTTTPQGSVVAQDTFTRANQIFWGTASDTHPWSSDASTNSAFSISNNLGVVSGGTTPYNAILGPSGTDDEVLTSGSISSFSNTNLGAVLRWTDTNNWYKAYINGTQLVLQKKVGGTTTTLKSAIFSATAATAYSIRFRIVGSTLSAKAWQVGTTEPASWTLTTTDTSLLSGFSGLRIQLQSGVSASFSAFQVTDLSGV